MKFLLLIFLSLALTSELIADQYLLDSVRIEIKNISQEKLITISLGYYYGSSRRIKETFTFDSAGTASFSGALHEGIYFLALPDTTFYEFMITRGKEYKLLINKQKRHYSFSIKANHETESYSLYNQMLLKFQTINDSLQTLVEKTILKDENQLIQQKISANTQDFEKTQADFLLKYSDSFFGKYLLSQQASVIPTKTEFADTLSQNIFIQKFNYYQQHYFDNIDWADCRMAFTSVLMEKVETYLFKVVPGKMEAKCVALNYLLSLPKDNKLKECLYDETLSLLKNTSHKPTNEFLYAYFIENYYVNGIAGWTSSEEINRLKLELNRIKPLLLNSITPECNLVSLTGSSISFPDDTPANLTVLVFWDLECHYCKRILYDLKKIIGKYDYLHPRVYSIYTGDNEDQWQIFSSTQLPANWINTKEANDPASRIYNIATLPSLFLISGESKILNKNFTVAELDAWLLKYSTSHK